MRDGYYSLVSGNGGGVFVHVRGGQIQMWDDGKGEIIGSILVEEREFCWTRGVEEPPRIVSDTEIQKGGETFHYRVVDSLDH